MILAANIMPHIDMTKKPPKNSSIFIFSFSSYFIGILEFILFYYLSSLICLFDSI